MRQSDVHVIRHANNAQRALSASQKRALAAKAPLGQKIAMALHEAAHAILAHHFGCTVAHLFLSNVGGETTYKLFEHDGRLDMQTFLFQRGVIAEAGPTIARKYLPVGDEFDQRTAYSMANALLNLNPSGPSKEDIIKHMRRRAKQLCRQYRLLIQHVACALLEHENLGRYEFLGEIEKFNGTAPSGRKS